MQFKHFFLVFFICVNFSVQAGNLTFLAETPITDFSKEELKSFKQFARKNMELLKDGQTAAWKSSTSKLKGIIKPELTYQKDGLTCRQTRFGLIGKKRQKMILKFDFCKHGDKWKIVQTPVSLFNDEDWKILRTELHQVLSEVKDGFPVSLIIRRLGVTGSIVPLNQHKMNGQDCRDAAISLSDGKGGTSNGRYTFCKVGVTWERSIKK